MSANPVATEKVSKTPPPLFDFSTPYQITKARLALFGLFIIIPTAVTGFLLTGILIYPGLALAGGIGAVMFVGGWMGWTMVLIQQAVQQVQIKIVQAEVPAEVTPPRPAPAPTTQ